MCAISVAVRTGTQHCILSHLPLVHFQFKLGKSLCGSLDKDLYSTRLLSRTAGKPPLTLQLCVHAVSPPSPCML